MQTERGEVPRFVETVLAAETDECIEWPYSVLKNGYPCLRRQGRTLRAHAHVCERAHGPRPEGRQAAHSCGHRTCVNPRHLSWKTRSENEADKIRHGTKVQGTAHYLCQLTDNDIAEIRRLRALGLTQATIAARFGIAQSGVSRIVNRRTHR